jgi:sugar lactone lactonase YvrE
LGTQPGTNAIFKVVFHEQHDRAKPLASASLLTYLPDAQFLNGLTKFNDTILLAADSALGAVWRINTATGDHTIVAKDTLMAPKPVDGYGEGINGLHYHGNRLYFSNSQRHLFASIALDHNGYQKGKAVQLATPVIEQGVNPNWDDFAIDHAGQFAYIATGIGNTIQRIDLNSGKIDICAGGLNNTAIAEPTSVVFGRTPHNFHTMYVATAGGLAYSVYTEDGPKQFGAQVVGVDVGKHHSN